MITIHERGGRTDGHRTTASTAGCITSRGKKYFGGAGSPSPWDGAWLTPYRNTPLSCVLLCRRRPRVSRQRSNAVTDGDASSGVWGGQVQSGRAIKLFRAPRKISFTFNLWHESFILDDVKLAELPNDSFEWKNVTFLGGQNMLWTLLLCPWVIWRWWL